MHDDIVVSIPRLDDSLDPKGAVEVFFDPTNYYEDYGGRTTECCKCDKC